MSEVVSVETPAGPLGLVRQPPRLIVQIGTAYLNGRQNHAAPGWFSLPELRVESIHDTDGAEPGTCEILVPFNVARRAEESAALGHAIHIPPTPDAGYEGTPGYQFYIRGPGEVIGGAGVKSIGAFKLIRVISKVKAPTGGNGGKFGDWTWNEAAGDYTRASSANTSREIEQVEFVGNVLSWTWDLARECVVLHCCDFRWRLARKHLYGIGYFSGTAADVTPTFTALRPALPIFNADGRPNRYIHIGPSGVSVPTVGFGASNLNTISGDAPRVAGSPFCRWFTVGDIIRYLRAWFSDAAGCGTTVGVLSYDGPEAEDKYLEWPDCSPGSYPGLFEAADPGDKAAETKPLEGKEINLSGAACSEALDHLLARAAQSVGGAWGAHGWKLVPVQGNPALMRLEIFNPAAVRADGKPASPTVDLHLPEPGESVAAMPRREIIGGQLSVDCSSYRNRILAVGGKKLIQASFCTIQDENGRRTLAPGWTPTEQENYRGADPAIAADPTLRYGLYPKVYREWGIPRTLDFAAAFFHWGVLPGTVGIGDGVFLPQEKRELGARLVQRRQVTSGQDDIPERLPILVWRSRDGGQNWERLPDGVRIDLNLDGPTIRLAPEVLPPFDADGNENLDAILMDGTGRPWTYDPDGAAEEPPYDLLVTMTVEADDRLNVLDDATSAEYPLEELHEAGLEYKYESASKSRIVDLDAVGGYPIETDLGGAAPEIVIDDTDRLAAVVRRKAAVLGQYPVTGSLVLAGFARHIRVGTVIQSIRTSLGDNGTRGPYIVKAVVREVEYAFVAEQETTLTLEGLPR